MFKLGLADAGRKYPLKDGSPKLVLLLDASVATAIDVDRWVNPTETSCDVYVLTDKGVHLLWLHPNRPSPEEAAFGDPIHKKLNLTHWPLFFESKFHGRLRTCAARTAAGLTIANEYNAKAIAVRLKMT